MHLGPPASDTPRLIGPGRHVYTYQPWGTHGYPLSVTSLRWVC